MQNYKFNHHNEIDHKRLTPMTTTQENPRVSNVRGNNQGSYTISTRRVPLRHSFFGQRSNSPAQVKFVQREEFCEKAGRYLDECEPACNLKNLVNEVLEEKEAHFVYENKVKFADTKMGNAFYSKKKI
uniref:Uncharacterized protein n=1 Tax=Bactrocera latifrons TaxID=174628 RepID=A0A0K8WF47_BACLA